ncbi:hypothetical protein MTO96_026350 [Rhipicephalus appendiculatus]
MSFLRAAFPISLGVPFYPVSEAIALSPLVAAEKTVHPEKRGVCQQREELFPLPVSPPVAEGRWLARGPGLSAAREERVDPAPIPVAASTRVL